MAMTLRLEEGDAALLRAIADAQGISMHEAVLRSIRQTAGDLGHRVAVAQATDEMQQRWGDVLDRLGRA